MVRYRVRQLDNRAARRIVRSPERASRGGRILACGSQPAAPSRRISATSISAPSVHPPVLRHFHFWTEGRQGFSRRLRGRAVQIVFSRDADQGEEGVSTRVGQCGPHPARGRRLADRADRPFRRQPFARRMGEDGRQSDSIPRPCRSKWSARLRFRARPAICGRCRVPRRARRSGRSIAFARVGGANSGRDDFSGLASLDCALSSAAASPYHLLDRCMVASTSGTWKPTAPDLERLALEKERLDW